jgi:hypothetical protein
MENLLTMTNPTTYAYLDRMGRTRYFDTQNAALETVYEDILNTPQGYRLQDPEAFWPEHVAYGTTTKYSLPLVNRNGNICRKWLHIQLYRTDAGRYELNWYLN